MRHHSLAYKTKIIPIGAFSILFILGIKFANNTCFVIIKNKHSICPRAVEEVLFENQQWLNPLILVELLYFRKQVAYEK